MNDVERFLDRVRCGVGGSHELRRHLRKELHEHLAAEIERNVAAGMTQEEAIQKAIEEFGDLLNGFGKKLQGRGPWSFGINHPGKLETLAGPPRNIICS